jgi:hypothetical protein
VLGGEVGCFRCSSLQRRGGKPCSLGCGFATRGLSGTASVAGRTCSRIAPATAENAKPAKPDTNAPEKTARLTTTNVRSITASLRR